MKLLLKIVTLIGLCLVPILSHGEPIRTVDISTANYTFIGYGRNRIINGAMRIDQWNSGAVMLSSNTKNTYAIDRFFGNASNNGGATFTLVQTSSALPPLHTNALSYQVSKVSSATVSSTDTYNVGTIIEGSYVPDLGWGTVQSPQHNSGFGSPWGRSVNLSFMVKSSSAGVFSGSLSNAARDRSYPFTYTIYVSSAWEQKSIRVPPDTSGTWATDTSTGILVRWDMGSGSSLRGTANTWAASNYIGATGTGQLISVTASSWSITGVQVEISSAATTFEFRPDAVELLLCQRYRERETGAAYQHYITAGNENLDRVRFSVSKRATPAITLTGTGGNLASSRAIGPGIYGFTIGITATATGMTVLGNAGSGDAAWAADAEFR